ncbi:hypothetical protein LRAMOSA04499 [Lichtheimia ramosa]|uniref:Probable acetate kinase n=1 Tax=Lichtheimia ramosa TaxID=688394 RepID=A0A077WYK7_9FUNG|nr:hypothetical protein LRAMOSA04499 [Lichtheimia ramosa]
MFLIFNAGSSSLKFKLFDIDSLEEKGKGACSEIGSDQSTFSLNQQEPKQCQLKSHEDALSTVFQELKDTHVIKDEKMIKAIGHRVVHGGDRRKPVKVTSKTLKQLDEMTALAPLHNHRAVTVMEASLERMPDCDNYAYFDTMFHATLPKHIYTYPLPRQHALDKAVRKWGFHGLSHQFVSGCAANFLNKPLQNSKFITLHLGNGSSACAIANGESIDTTMGLTPVSGLPGGTRSGDVDPSAVFHLVSHPADPKPGGGVELAKAEHVLNKESGFKGLCGLTHMGDIATKAEQNNESAKLTFDLFVNRIQNFIGSYYILLEGCDVIVFTGGIGEHSAPLRQHVCEKLKCIGCKIDLDKNNHADTTKNKVVDITASDSSIRVLVIETNEELQIARLMKEQ